MDLRFLCVCFLLSSCVREQSSSLTFEPRANHQISNFPPPWKLTFHQQHCTLLGRKSGSPDQKFFSLGLSSTCQGLDKGVRFSSHYFFDHWTKFGVSLSRVAKLEITLRSHITNLSWIWRFWEFRLMLHSTFNQLLLLYLNF